MEVKYTVDAELWASWQLPCDKGNHRSQLRRMIAEWQAQRQLISELAAIHPDLRQAVAKATQAIALIDRATIVVQVPGQDTQSLAAKAAAPLEDPVDSDDFDIEFTEIEV